MEPSYLSTRAKRGCLWYIAWVIAVVFGLLALLMLLFIFGLVKASNDIGQHSIVVSADEQTYLEAVTSNHGEGYLDGYDWLEVYYVHSGWFWNNRVRVYNIPNVSASQVNFRRSLDQNGQIQIQIKHKPIYADSVVLATFVPPASFPEK